MRQRPTAPDASSAKPSIAPARTAIGAGIIFAGFRFLFAPQAAAAEYGMPVEPIGARKAKVAAVAPGFTQGGARHRLGHLLVRPADQPGPRICWGLMAATSIIPVGDAVIVLRSGGTRATASGIHGNTAAVAFRKRGAALGMSAGLTERRSLRTRNEPDIAVSNAPSELAAGRDE